MRKSTVAALGALTMLAGAPAIAGPVTEPTQPVPSAGGKGDPQAGPGGGQPTGAPTPPATSPSPTPSPTAEAQKITKSRSNIQNN